MYKAWRRDAWLIVINKCQFIFLPFQVWVRLRGVKGDEPRCLCLDKVKYLKRLAREACRCPDSENKFQGPVKCTVILPSEVGSFS